MFRNILLVLLWLHLSYYLLQQLVSTFLSQWNTTINASSTIMTIEITCSTSNLFVGSFQSIVIDLALILIFSSTFFELIRSLFNMRWCRPIKRCSFPILLTPGRTYVIFIGCIVRSNGQDTISVVLGLWLLYLMVTIA